MWVYIMASGWNGTIYVGVTNSLSRRVTEHREGRGSQFVRQYGVSHLVYAERFDRADEAIAQEKRMKKWHRQRKVALIEAGKPKLARPLRHPSSRLRPSRLSPSFRPSGAAAPRRNPS